MPLSILFVIGGIVFLIVAPDADAGDGLLCMPPLGPTGAKVAFGAVGLALVIVGAGMLRRSRLAWYGMFAYLALGAIWNLALGVTLVFSPPDAARASFHFAGTATAALIGVGLYYATRPVFACPFGRIYDAECAFGRAPCDLVFDSCIYMGGSRNVPHLHPLRMAICPDALVFSGVGVSAWFVESFQIPLDAIIGVRRIEWSEGAAWNRGARAPGFERFVRQAENREPVEGLWNWVEIKWEERSSTRAEIIMFTVRRPFPWFMKSRWRHPEPLTAEFCRVLRSALPAESQPRANPGPAT